MAAVCARVSHGELVKYAAAAEGSDARQIREWSLLDEFAPLYERARVNQAHALAEEALDIADGNDDEAKTRQEAMIHALTGVKEVDKERLLYSLQSVAVQRDRVRVDTRKWLTSKIAPKIFSERLQHSGPNEGPLQVTQCWSFGGKTVTF